MTTSIAALRTIIEQHCLSPRHQTAIPRVRLTRAEAPTAPEGSLYRPVVCFVAQGAKHLMLGGRTYEYNAAKYLIVSVDLPVTGGIVRASPDEPYLAVSLELDPPTLASLLLEMGERGFDQPCSAGLAVSEVTDDLLDAVSRLLLLLETPADIPILAPLIEREILYRLLRGRQGGMLRQIALADSRLSRIGRAIAWIRAHYAEPFRIEDVAEAAGMSPASLHRHFRTVTALSPLQFQKQLRLQEARRLLIARRSDVAMVSFTVGYGSPSQFSREYSRLFGAPPARDPLRLSTPAAALDGD